MTSPLESGGAQAERRVHALNVRAAFEDFAFQNPARTDQSTELADNLIWFDDAVVLFQVKSRESGRVDTPERASAWLKKNAAKAAKQAQGTVRAIRLGHLNSLINARRGALAFDPHAVRRFHSVIILDHPNAPLTAQQELGGSGLPSDAPTHVLSLADWDSVVAEHDTTPDLLTWLDERAALLPTVTFYLDHEADAIALGLRKGGRLEPADFPDGVVEVGYAAHFAETFHEAIARRARADEFSRGIDELIDVAHTGSADLITLPDWLEESALQSGGWTYADIALELARTTRLHRRQLGERMFEKAVLTGQDGREHYFAAPLPSGTWFVFVASSKARKDRLQRATLIAHALKQRMKADRILGVATESAQSTERTYDFWLMDMPYAPDPEFDSRVAGAFGDPINTTTHEFPAE